MSKVEPVKILPDGRMDTVNAAIYIGRKQHTLAQWRSDGCGPPYVKCGRIYYYKDEIDEWLRKGRKG